MQLRSGKRRRLRDAQACAHAQQAGIPAKRGKPTPTRAAACAAAATSTPRKGKARRQAPSRPSPPRSKGPLRAVGTPPLALEPARPADGGIEAGTRAHEACACRDAPHLDRVFAGNDVVLRVDVPADFSLSQAICSHGFYALAPNVWVPAPSGDACDDHGYFKRPLR